MQQESIKNTVPDKYLLGSALIQTAYYQLSQKNSAAKVSDVLAFIAAKMEAEPNAILADLYQQAIDQIVDAQPVV